MKRPRLVLNPVLHQGFAEHISSPEQSKKTHNCFLFVVWNKANRLSEVRWRREIINIVYTARDRQTCSQSLQSQQAALPVVACLGWMEERDPHGMVWLVLWVLAQTLFLYCCFSPWRKLLEPLNQIDSFLLYFFRFCVPLFFLPFLSGINIRNM